MKRMNGSVALVTGAGRGIGKAIALAVAAEGANVVLAARSQNEIEAVAAECRAEGVEVLAVRADLSEAADISNAVASAIKRFGRIDLLVNNAGVGFFKPVRSLPLEEFDEMWKVNIRAPFLAIREVLPSMEASGSGCIVNIGSLAGKNPVKEGAAYAATKWALRGFASSLMLEAREDLQGRHDCPRIGRHLVQKGSAAGKDHYPP